MEKSPLEKAFWEYSEPYTGMRLVDMEKSSHGRAFIAGWEAAEKHVQAALCDPRLLRQLLDAAEIGAK